MVTFAEALDEHLELFRQLRPLGASVELAAARIGTRIAAGAKLLICGNGGSAATAQHIAAEFTGRLVKNRKALAAIALSSDGAALTAIGNDFGFDQVFARQVAALGRESDCLLVLSTSGNSRNVIEAAKAAAGIGMPVIGLLGGDGGELRALCNIEVTVPSKVTARIQEAHELIGHVICARVESLWVPK